MQPSGLNMLYTARVHVVQVAEAPKTQQRAADIIPLNRLHCNDLNFNRIMGLIDAPKRIFEMSLAAFRPFLGQYYQARCHLSIAACACSVERSYLQGLRPPCHDSQGFELSFQDFCSLFNLPCTSLLL
jgi:hypothetical protein